MFFDKHYRPERYKDITESMDKYKNINEFRTVIVNKYSTFPISAISTLKMIKN